MYIQNIWLYRLFVAITFFIQTVWSQDISIIHFGFEFKTYVSYTLILKWRHMYCTLWFWSQDICIIHFVHSNNILYIPFREFHIFNHSSSFLWYGITSSVESSVMPYQTVFPLAGKCTKITIEHLIGIGVCAMFSVQMTLQTIFPVAIERTMITCKVFISMFRSLMS